MYAEGAVRLCSVQKELFGSGVQKELFGSGMCTEGAVRMWCMQKELYGCGYSLAGMQFAGYNVLNMQC